MGTLADGRLELVTTPGMVTRDELEVFRADSDPPERPERRTVWPSLGGDRIAFEVQQSADGGAGRSTAAAVTLERVWSPE